jgi:DNA-binding Xre family transcriptional regulator
MAPETQELMVAGEERHRAGGIIAVTAGDSMSDEAKDAPEVRVYDEAKRRLASGEDELIPAEFANRILGGESPVRVWCEYRGLTANELATRAGISEADLGQIESGDLSRVGVLKRIAVVLNVDLDDLI